MKRSNWTVRNTTNRELSIGDLLRAPAIRPGHRVDLLRFHTKVELDNSSDLAKLLNLGWLKIIKMDIQKNKKVALVQEDMLDSAIADATIQQVVTVTDDYEMSLDDDIVLCDTSTTNIAITLPETLSGKVVHIKKISPGVGIITISSAFGETIDGQASIEIEDQWTSVTLVTNGNVWFVL